MDALLARYLDGTLSEEEASSFLDAVRRDPALERELRAYETLLHDASRLPAIAPSAGFTDGVMDRVRREDKEGRRSAVPSVPSERASSAFPAEARGPAGRPARILRFPAPLAMAASVLVLLGAGYLAGRTIPLVPARVGAPAGSTTEAGGPLSSATWSTSLPGGDDLHVVRLIYRSASPEVREMAVAGTFNDWDPTANVMRKEGDVWSIVLVLPPGSYEYMFVENGEDWVSDPLAPRTRDDGFGGANAVLDVAA